MKYATRAIFPVVAYTQLLRAGPLASYDNKADMEKGADTRTLSAEIFENCGNLYIVEDYAPLFSEENLFLVEMFDETFNIWHIYSL